MSDSALTTTDIIATATDVLARGGFRRISESSLSAKVSRNTRFFEDPYSVTEVVVYETWNDLALSWTDAQASLVELISRYVVSSESKAWDGYLVLLTPSLLPKAAFEHANQIRNNMTRVRKLLATGDDLTSTSEVERVLMPLLPLSNEAIGSDEQIRALDLLPAILGRRGIDTEAVKVLIRSFLDQQPMLERLHNYWSKQ
jgi:hypothetical protein